jgi:hypothetical protein
MSKCYLVPKDLTPADDYRFVLLSILKTFSNLVLENRLIDDIKIVKLTSEQISIEDFNTLTKSCNREYMVSNTSSYGIISQEFKNIFTNRIELLISFICPITRTIMIDPVICADNITYEREAITLWLETNNISPFFGQPLISKDLIPNDSLRDAIQMFQRERSGATQSSSSDGNLDQSKLMEYNSSMFFLKSILSLFRNERDPYLLYSDHLSAYQMDCSLPRRVESAQGGLERMDF